MYIYISRETVSFIGIKLFLKGSYGIDMHVSFSRLKEVLTLDLENIP